VWLGFPVRFDLTLQGACHILPTVSGFVMSAIPIAESNKVVLLNAAASNPCMREGGDYIFSGMTPRDLEGLPNEENGISVRIGTPVWPPDPNP
jgi:hypothetical protein